MSRADVIEKPSYLVTATEAGNEFGYTKDYILMLIKSEKISGEKIGHKWFVDIRSAKDFFNAAQKQKIERSQKIREERKAELAARTSQTVVVTTGLVPSVKSDTLDQEILSTAIVAAETSPRGSHMLLETMAIAVLGVLVGGAAYLGTATTSTQWNTSVSQNGSIIDVLALNLYNGLHKNVAQVGGALQENNASNQASVSHTSTTSAGLVVVPEKAWSTTTAEEIAQSFSDEVRVTPDEDSEGSGIIVPVFKEREGDAYRYVMVPVAASPP